MLGSRNLFLSLFFLLSLLSVVARSEYAQGQGNNDDSADHVAFQKLLEGVDENRIHTALHRWSNKFRDGIFSKDRTALEAVHREDPRLATRLVHLARRQNSNSTITTSKASESSSPTTRESSSQAAATTETAAATTTENGAETSQATEATGESSFRRISSTVISTTTLPNGQQSTITGVTVVNAPATGTEGGSGGANPTSTGEGSPSLQSGAASPSTGLKKEILAMMGGAVVVAMALQ